MTDPLTLSINGVPEACPPGTLATLLAGRGIVAGARGVAVALNGNVVPAARWGETALAAGDALEIVRPYAGG
jgi:sulfur carrier protein